MYISGIQWTIIYWVPGTVPDVGNTELNKKVKISLSWSFQTRGTINTNKHLNVYIKWFDKRQKSRFIKYFKILKQENFKS